MASVFREALEFFYDIGIYDVVLPFLLVFTLVFAILEKSKIFGVMKIENTEYTRKNLNAMIAFVTSFLVVGSTQIVSVINRSIANVVVLLVLSVFFLILAGSFNKDEEYYLKGGWNKLFMWIMFVGIILIFLEAMGWLHFIYTYVSLYWTSSTLSGVILIIIVILLMYFITKEPASKQAAKKEES